MNDPFEILAKLQERIPPERLEAYGIDWFLVLRIVGADLESIVELSNRLLEDTAVNQRLPVGRDEVVSPADAKTLTVAMLNACSVFGSLPPDHLLKLNGKLLGADIQPRRASKAPAKKLKAFLMVVENPQASVREIARKAKVSVGTASRWRNEFRRLQSRALDAVKKIR